jgi:hypothetical protein
MVSTEVDLLVIAFFGFFAFVLRRLAANNFASYLGEGPFERLRRYHLYAIIWDTLKWAFTEITILYSMIVVDAQPHHYYYVATATLATAIVVENHKYHFIPFGRKGKTSTARR